MIFLKRLLYYKHLIPVAAGLKPTPNNRMKLLLEHLIRDISIQEVLHFIDGDLTMLKKSEKWEATGNNKGIRRVFPFEKRDSQQQSREFDVIKIVWWQLTLSRQTGEHGGCLELASTAN